MLKLAVYGTLKKGFYNHSLLAAAKYVRDAVILGEMFLYKPGNFPVLINDKDTNFTREYHCEIYEVPVWDFLAIARMEVGAGYLPEYNEELDAYVFYGIREIVEDPAYKDSFQEIERYEIS
jgi:gamma-glutamylcyclotransferase (GGCT)/AIG2-like uncharacterized protein YtfP